MLQKKFVDPRGVAEQYLKQHKNNVVNATNAMTNAVMADIDLYRTIMDPLVRMACYDFIRQVCQTDRRRVWNTKQPTAAEEARNVHHLGDGISSAYMMFPLPGGKYLKDAYAEDITQASEFFLNQGHNMTIKGNWLRLIGLKLAPKKKVSEVFDEKDLAKFRTQAEKNI